MESNARAWIATLRQSHERLLGLVGPLSPEQISGPSYCSDWSAAQVLMLGALAPASAAILLVALALRTGARTTDAYNPV